VLDRCYLVPDGKGGHVRVRAGKKPDKKTQVALRDLFKAAYAHLKAKQEKKQRA
jgi:hypothetical protein